MRQNIPNTFGLDVYAKQVITVDSVQALLCAWQEAQAANLPALIIGEASNSLFVSDFAGVIIVNRIGGISLQETESEWILEVGAGEKWHHVVEYTIQNQIPGLENLALIPGCIGSAAIQNIGAYGVELKQVAGKVTLLELTTGKKVTVTDGEYGYRDSIFKHKFVKNYAVISVELRLAKKWRPNLSYGELKNLEGDNVTSRLIYETVTKVRRSKLPDPTMLGNAGSFFKNPVVCREDVDRLLVDYPDMPIYHQKDDQYKLSAGWLIDQSGLKGYQIGGAAVDQKHALVLVNKDNATSQDVVNLARYICATVNQKFSVKLSPEIRFIDKLGEVDADKFLKE
ncbi:UDP-N-acetylmuramate dehydrogenase [Orbaceae bacterium ESL0721]|nr:UDP-N-acetylmuramate dehydrogenase [Orbaceae bacterium ESL0721]